jgi:hypothetical protein
VSDLEVVRLEPTPEQLRYTFGGGEPLLTGSAAAGDRQHGGDPLTVRAGGPACTDPGPVLGAPHLDDRPADGELHLAVQLGCRTVRLDRVPGVDLDGRVGA